MAGDYRALRRVRPLVWYETGEAVGMGAVLALGAAGLAAGTGFLSNFLPKGTSGHLFSAGTVALFSCAVGIAVGSGVVVLLAQFLEEYLGADEGAR
ncbi:MnhB domain-containing protein [Nocardia nova]